MLFTHAPVVLATAGVAFSLALPYNEGADGGYHGWSTITPQTDGGNCMLGGTPAGGFPGLAISAQLWDGGGKCGACVTVRTTAAAKAAAPDQSGSGCVTAMVMDKCPECEAAHVDLWPEARKPLGYGWGDENPQVDWSFTACDHSICGGGGGGNGGGNDGGNGGGWNGQDNGQGNDQGGGAQSLGPLKIHVKEEGVSQWWFAAQVQGAVGATQAMEAQTTSGWKPMQKQDYNYFTLDGGTGSDAPTSIKVTSAEGKVVVVDNVPIQSGATVSGTSNYQ